MAETREAAPAAREMDARTAYLLVYNAVCFVGWLLTLAALCYAHLFDGGVWNSVEVPLKLTQTLAVLEPLHSVFGVVRANPTSTALQVSSRLYLLWAIANVFEDVEHFLAFSTMIAAWGLSEVPRYLYFTVAQLGKPSYWLTWLRYSSFIALYPLGVASEMSCVYLVLPQLRAARPFSVSMPNALNFSFDSYLLSVIILAMYLPGLPMLYYHMLRQRRRHLGGSKSDRKRVDAAASAPTDEKTKTL